MKPLPNNFKEAPFYFSPLFLVILSTFRSHMEFL